MGKPPTTWHESTLQGQKSIQHIQSIDYLLLPAAFDRSQYWNMVETINCSQQHLTVVNTGIHTHIHTHTPSQYVCQGLCQGERSWQAEQQSESHHPVRVGPHRWQRRVRESAGQLSPPTASPPCPWILTPHVTFRVCPLRETAVRMREV